ncbi:MAG: mevalonate kinase [Candidatus Thorarchaeota archaeon]|jgi:mevalonate kinase
MGTGTGKGKSILFGEHFVVYGIPAIATGIANETVAHVSRSKGLGWTLDDRRLAVPGYKEKKVDEQRVSIENVLRFCKVDTSKEGIHIELEGDLVCASGIGASAASCVALARALNDEYGLGLDDNAINQAAYEGEMGYHGTPSGLDNTASTFGGLIWFVRDMKGGPPAFEALKLKESANLVIGSTGLTASTTEVVGDVRAKKEDNPTWFDKISRESETLATDARDALLELNLKRVGELMNRNHEILQELTVSCKELDEFVAIAKKNGALGAKLTGTGRGGNIIALAPDETTRNKIAKVLENSGAALVYSTSFGR